MQKGMKNKANKANKAATSFLCGPSFSEFNWYMVYVTPLAVE